MGSDHVRHLQPTRAGRSQPFTALGSPSSRTVTATVRPQFPDLLVFDDANDPFAGIPLGIGGLGITAGGVSPPRPPRSALPRRTTVGGTTAAGGPPDNVEQEMRRNSCPPPVPSRGTDRRDARQRRLSGMSSTSSGRSIGLLGGMSLLNMNDMNETASPFNGDNMVRSAGGGSNDGSDGKEDAAQSQLTQRWETLAHMFHEIGLHRYIQRFDEERIDLAAAQLLGDGDLERMGLRLGDRLKLRAAVAQLDAVRLGSSGAGAS